MDSDIPLANNEIKKPPVAEVNLRQEVLCWGFVSMSVKQETNPLKCF